MKLPPHAMHPRPDTLQRRPWLAATLWLALLGPSFFAVYGVCNAVSAHRGHVGSLFFAWERHIPFVPWMIIPYLSIDLFFAASFFLCRDRAELRVHAARIALAIAISGAAFLLFPLRYGWARPAVGGWLGVLFAPLNALDQPYNLCPSLHISLRAIIWCVFARRLGGQGIWHTLLWIWFGLIGLSTLFVYQHHVIDLAGGCLVAVLCCRWIREPAARTPRAAASSPEPSNLPSTCLPTSSLPPSLPA